jgi:iron complex outermembrane receptor protein
MRVKTLVLGSASLTILALTASPAYAQGGTPPPPADSNAAAPATASEANASPAAADAAGDEAIVVTGLRRSLQSAENIKRNSDTIVDAIVAEDIGKLPDVAVSDTAARIPGVQVERGGGEAGRVLVRGLPDVETTYNGREIFTAETRRVALQDFPSGAIGAVEVYKTSTADLVEPGIAGLVNVRSHRPFDFKGFAIAGSVWGLYPKQSGKWTPNGNLLISDRWRAGDGEIGALINFSYTELQYLDSTRSNTDFVAGGPNGTRYPDVMRIDYGSGDRSRPSVNGALQWRPHPGLEFYVEGLWQGFRNKISDREMTVPLWGGQQYTNLVTRPGTNLLQSGTVVNPFRPDGFQGGTFNKTDTYQFAAGGIWDSGPWRVSADVARTNSTFKGSTGSVDYALVSPQTVTFNNDVPRGDGGPEFSFANFDAGNPANYTYRGFFEEAQIAKGKDWQGRLDVAFEPTGSFISKIEGGLRYVDRDAHRQYGNHYWGGDVVLNQHIPITAVPLDYEFFHSGFRGSNIQPFRDWLAPTYGSIRDNFADMRAFSRSIGDPANLGPPAPFPDQTYSANEKTASAYGQIKYQFGSSIPIDGVIGVRAVNTDLNINGTTIIGGVATPVALHRQYTDWLPNISARIKFNSELQLRLSATKTRTRPDFAQYNPGGTADPPPSCVQNTTSCVRNFNGGNPFLNTVKTNNYDASLEYYFSRNGFASIGAFRRDLTGYIINFQSFVTDPSYGLVRANRPFNTKGGRIQGFEGQFQTFLDIGSLPEWVRGFGVLANFTYLDTRITLPADLGGATTRIPGVSKWSYNLGAMYEHGGLSLRLSYNYRTHWLSLYRPDPGFPTSGRLYQEETRGVGRLDFSGSYNLFENLTLFADWTNMLGKPYRTVETTSFAGGDTVQFPRAVRYEETIYSAGVRFRF